MQLLPLSLGRQKPPRAVLEKALPAATPAWSESHPILYIKEEQGWRVPQRKGDQRLDKLPSLRRGAVPELGAWLQQQTFILVAPGKTFMLFRLGWSNWAGKEVRDNRQSHCTWLHASVVQFTRVLPFPFFLFPLLLF